MDEVSDIVRFVSNGMAALMGVIINFIKILCAGRRVYLTLSGLYHKADLDVIDSWGLQLDTLRRPSLTNKNYV